MLGLNEAIAVTAILVTLIGIFIQNRHTAKIAKSRFILDINNDLNAFASTRNLVNNKSYEAIVQNKDSLDYETLLDYLTLFENLYHLHLSKVLSLNDISIYFGGRFSELMDSDFVKNNTENLEFKKMYDLLYKLKSILKEKGLYVT